MSIKNKNDWFSLLDYLSDDDMVATINVFVKPMGHVYVVKDEGDYTTLTSSDRVHYNDPISRELVALGYEGVVALESIDSNEKPKSWLNKYLDNSNDMSERDHMYYEAKIRIHTFGECAPSNVYNIQYTLPSPTYVGDVEELNATRGSSNNCDGLIFQFRDEWYHILPTRIVRGQIRSAEKDTMLVIVKMDGITRPILTRWVGKSDPKEYIGKYALVKYTKALPTTHVNALLSPVIYEDRILSEA